MPDREKVIKGLEQCVGYEDADNEYSCIYDGDTNPNCPYAGTGGNSVSCMTKMMRDALAVLKAQEPVKPIMRHVEFEYDTFSEWENKMYCPKCKMELLARVNYCPKCGQAVKWE